VFSGFGAGKSTRGGLERAAKKWMPVFRDKRALHFGIDQLSRIRAIPLEWGLI
jgi:hypothetical protein